MVVAAWAHNLFINTHTLSNVTGLANGRQRMGAFRLVDSTIIQFRQ